MVIKRQSELEGTLTSHDVTHIFFDLNNRMWVSTRFGGVNIYDAGKKKFPHYKSNNLNPNSLFGDNVTSFAEDDYGNLWVGVDGGGLNYLDRTSNTFTHILSDPDTQEGLSNDKVLSLLMASDGRLWIGFWAGGVNVYNPFTEEFVHYRHDPDDPYSLSGDNIYSLFEDSQGNIWIGTWGSGLNKYNPEMDNFTRYQHDPDDPTSIANSGCIMIREDYQGNIWIAMEGAGLSIYYRQNNSFATFTQSDDENSLTNESVFSLFEDSRDRMWIGTNGGGLCLYNRNDNNFKAYRMIDGLPNDVIFGIVEDEKGYLWLSTNEGLSKFNPDSISFKNYDASDGLQSNQFGRWASVRLSSGELAFGGVNGFNLFHPDLVTDNEYKPPVYITGFKLFNEDVGIGKESVLKKSILMMEEIRLKHNQNIFSFEFIALNYRQPEKNQYMYRMEGFNDTWINCKNERKVSFTNLNPGEYTFTVKASNNDGVWNDEGASIKVVIVPPFYRSWWFITLIAIIVVSLYVNFVLQRNKRQKHDKEILERNIREGKLEVEKQKKEIEQQQIVLKEKEESEASQKWYNAGLAKFSNLVSKNKDELKTMARLLISELVAYVDGRLGGMYIVINEEDAEIYLEMLGYYAPDETKLEETKIMPGEGYIGSCYIENKNMIIDNLPDSYAKLSSGLGGVSLKYLIAIPVRLDEVVVGVIEILSIEKLDNYKIDFIEKLGELIAATIMTSLANEKIRRMYEEVKMQTEAMKATEEELQQNLEEISATQEEFHRQREEFEDNSRNWQEKENDLKKEISKLRSEIRKLKK